MGSTAETTSSVEQCRNIEFWKQLKLSRKSKVFLMIFRLTG